MVTLPVDGEMSDFSVVEPKVSDGQWHEFNFLTDPNRALFWVDHENVIKGQPSLIHS